MIGINAVKNFPKHQCVDDLIIRVFAALFQFSVTSTKIEFNTTMKRFCKEVIMMHFKNRCITAGLADKFNCLNNQKVFGNLPKEQTVNQRYCPGVSFCSVRHAFVFYTCHNSFKRKEALKDSAMSNKINLSIGFILPFTLTSPIQVWKPISVAKNFLCSQQREHSMTSTRLQVVCPILSY